jgi:hypothetical protein
MLQRFIILILISTSIFFVDYYYRPSPKPPITRQFEAWLANIESIYHKNTPPTELEVNIERRIGNDLKKWQLNSANSEMNRNRLTLRALQLIKAGQLIKPSFAYEGDGLYIGITDGKESFYSNLPIEELKENIQARNLLVLLENQG